MNIKRDLIILALICLALVSTWYKPGFVIGGGEEALAFVNPKITALNYKYPWNGQAMGRPLTIGYSRYPVFEVLGYFNEIGVGADLLQINLFSLLLVMAAFSTYYLGAALFPEKKRVPIAASLFYLLNPYTFANVWHRFNSPMFFFFALFPFSILCLLRFIKKPKFVYFLLFIISNTLLSYSFSSPANVLTLWISLAGVAFAYSLRIHKKEAIKTFASLFIFAVFWLLTNWWHIKFIVGPSVSFYSKIFSTDQNLNVLRSISIQYPLNIFVRLGYPSVFSNLQHLTFWIIPLVSLFALITTRSKSIRIITMLLLVSFFVLNGSNFPTGPLFEYIFKNISALHLFRNPYEKFGIVLSLSYSLLFSLGLFNIGKKFKRIRAAIIIAAILLAINLWKVSVFGSEQYNAYIKVPGDYELVNNFLQKDAEARFLSIPFNPGDGTSYNWDRKFYGTQPNRNLFSNSSLNKIERIEGYDNYWRQLRKAFYVGRLGELLKYSAIKYIVLHKDINPDYSGSLSPSLAKSYLLAARKPTNLARPICINLELGANCDLQTENIDFASINFFELNFVPGSSGYLKFDLQDNNAKHLIYDGQLEERYRINEQDIGKEISLTLDVNNATTKYQGISIPDLKYLLIEFYDEKLEKSNQLDIKSIKADKGKHLSVDFTEQVMSLDNLEVYTVKNEFVKDKIYATRSISKIENWDEIVYGDIAPEGFVLSDHLNEIDFSITTDYLPEIKINKRSPVRYSIDVKNAAEPFWLIFSETYYPNWQLKSSGDNFKHFQVNGFTNGYYVDKLGNYQLKLEYLRN